MSKSPVSPLEDASIARLTRAIYLGETQGPLLIRQPAARPRRPRRNHTPLFAAIENDNMAAFEALLERVPAPAPIEFGETPLHAAARRGNRPWCAAGARRRVLRRSSGRTINSVAARLMEAAIGRSLPIIKLLLGLGAITSPGRQRLDRPVVKVAGKRVANHLRKLMDKSPQATEVISTTPRAGLLEHVRAARSRRRGRQMTSSGRPRCTKPS
jgi:hypothetical protein